MNATAWEKYKGFKMVRWGEPPNHGRIVGEVDTLHCTWVAYGKYGKSTRGRAGTEAGAFEACEKAIRKLWPNQ